MKTAEGWYQLAKGWLQSLEDMDWDELTTFEKSLLYDLRRHVPDMEEKDECSKGQRADT